MSKVSVLMPVYNGETFLRDAIDSIIGQTYSDWELIIINDGSTDQSENIIKSYIDPRIRYYKNEQNIGLIATLNRGIDLCSGKFIARMDADDISTPERLKQQIDFLEKNNEYVMCGCNATVIDKNNNETGKIINLSTNEYLRINLLFSVPFIHPSVMIKTDILKELKYDPDYKYAEDYDLWCRIANKGKIYNIPNLSLKYRWHTTNVSVKNSKAQEGVKNNIIQRQIESLGISANKKELFLHKVTFQQYNAKEKQKNIEFNEYNNLDKWFLKIISANKKTRKYNSNALIAYLWSRWIVLCISQKKIRKILSPKFVSYKPAVLFRTFKLVYHLSQK
jgi:glycosyltransferase involved in cell wall biosynthesis